MFCIYARRHARRRSINRLVLVLPTFVEENIDLHQISHFYQFQTLPSTNPLVPISPKVNTSTAQVVVTVACFNRPSSMAKRKHMFLHRPQPRLCWNDEFEIHPWFYVHLKHRMTFNHLSYFIMGFQFFTWTQIMLSLTNVVIVTVLQLEIVTYFGGAGGWIELS